MSGEEPDDQFSSSLLKLWWSETSLLRELSHPQRPTPPLLDQTPAKADIGDERIPWPRWMGTLQILHPLVERKSSGAGDLQSIIKNSNAHRATASSIIPVT